jgi:hypothetical protein
MVSPDIPYLDAAKHGDRQSKVEVARCLYYGLGTVRSYTEAAHWYRKAAKQGDHEAQYVIGRAYELGEGVRKSNRWAIYWYQKATAGGHRYAKELLNELRTQRGTPKRRLPKKGQG